MLINFIKNKIDRIDEHIQELLYGSLVAFLLKILGAAFSLILNVLLARFLGVEGFGIFLLAFTIVLIVAAIGRVGMENALVRFIASNVVAKQPSKVLGVYRIAMFSSLVVATFLSLFLYVLAPWISDHIFAKPELAVPLSIMSIVVVPLALLTLHAHALQGLKKIVPYILILSVAVPLLSCFTVILFVPKYGINSAVCGYLFATIITLFLSRWLWKRATESFINIPAQFNTQELFSSSVPLLGVVIMSLIITWSPILFLGLCERNTNVGIYGAANRISMLISFVLVAVNSIAAPKFAALYKQGDFETLGKVARGSAKVMVFLASPALLTFLLFPEWILSMFGDQFKQGALVLKILVIGQFVNVSTGSVGYLLLMSGNESLMRKNLIFCASLGVVLNYWLIVNYGVVGGAIGATIILSLQNFIAMVLVWRNLNIWVFPFMGFNRFFL